MVLLGSLPVAMNAWDSLGHKAVPRKIPTHFEEDKSTEPPTVPWLRFKDNARALPNPRGRAVAVASVLG